MSRTTRLVFGLLLFVGAARAVFYLLYAVLRLPSSLETFHLESKMVLLAYRVSAGDSLYPAWADYPHVANFFGPVYFLVVGWLGRLAGAHIPALFFIGRAVTFTAAWGTTASVWIYLARRYDRHVALAGALLTIGAPPMIGFSVMVRADMLAELFGVVGFLSAVQGSRASRVTGVVCLALAMLTKQTTGVFLLAAAIALYLDGDYRGCWRLLAGCALLVGGALVLGTLCWEPRLARDFIGELDTPRDLSNWLGTLRRMRNEAPDLLLIPLMAVVMLRLRGEREPVLTAFTAVFLAASVVTSLKRGADLNYYLSLRVAEGLAIGTIARLSTTATTRRERAISLLAIVLATCSLLPSAESMVVQAMEASKYTIAIARSAKGRVIDRTYQKYFRLAEDPNVRLLTDVGLIDLHQKERAAFGDPWLFRMLVETGRINPTKIRRWLDTEEYDLIVTNQDLFAPTYTTYGFLPKVLADSARAHYVRSDYAYVPSSFTAELFIYQRRGQPPAHRATP